MMVGVQSVDRAEVCDAAREQHHGYQHSDAAAGDSGKWHQAQDAWFRASSAATQEIMAHLTLAA